MQLKISQKKLVEILLQRIEILEKNGGVSQFVDFSAPIKYIIEDDMVDLTQN